MAPAAIVMSFGSGQIAAQIASDEAGRWEDGLKNLAKVVCDCMWEFSHNMSDYQKLLEGDLEIMMFFVLEKHS